MTGITCAWCGEPATTSIEVEPASTRVIQTPQGKRSTPVPARRLAACAAHGNPDPSAPKAKASVADGQIDIFQALEGEAM